MTAKIAIKKAPKAVSAEAKKKTAPKPKKTVKKSAKETTEKSKPAAVAGKRLIKVRTISRDHGTDDVLNLREEYAQEDRTQKGEQLFKDQIEETGSGYADKVRALSEIMSGSTKSDVEKDAQVRQYDMENKINFKGAQAKPLNIYRKISISFVVLALLLLAVICYFSIVKVDISVALKKEQAPCNTVIDITDKAGIASSTTGVSGIVKSVDVEVTKEIAATGQAPVAKSLPSSQVADDVIGTVKIVNNYVRNQPLVASTRLMNANGQIIRIKKTVNIPAGGSVEVGVYPDKAAADISVPVGTRLTIPGLWSGIQDKIYAEMISVSGGISETAISDGSKNAVTQNDIEGSRNMIVQEFDRKIASDTLMSFKTQYSQVMYKIDENSIVLEPQAKVGEVADSFVVRATAKVIIVAFNSQDVAQRASDLLQASLPSDKKITQVNPADFKFELDTVNVENGTAVVKLNYTCEVIARDQAIVDKTKLIGLTASQLQSYLSSLPAVGTFTVKFTPGFLGRVPEWPDRINITISNQ
jgi:hypothetical protein